MQHETGYEGGGRIRPPLWRKTTADDQLRVTLKRYLFRSKRAEATVICQAWREGGGGGGGKWARVELARERYSGTGTEDSQVGG